MSYHEWKSLTKGKGAEASIVWVREAQAGADHCSEDSDYKKLQTLAESNFLKPTSGRTDVARFGEVALEAPNNFCEDKVSYQFVDNTVYC